MVVFLKAKLTHFCTAAAVIDQTDGGADGSKQKARTTCQIRTGIMPGLAWGFLFCAVKLTASVYATRAQAFKRLRKTAGAAADADAALAPSVELSPERAASPKALPSRAKVGAARVIDDDDDVAVVAPGPSAAREVVQSEDDDNALAVDDEEDEQDEAKDPKGKRPAKRSAAKAKSAATGVGGKSVAAAAAYLKYDVAKAAEGMWKVRALHSRANTRH